MSAGSAAQSIRARLPGQGRTLCDCVLNEHLWMLNTSLYLMNKLFNLSRTLVSLIVLKLSQGQNLTCKVKFIPYIAFNHKRASKCITRPHFVKMSTFQHGIRSFVT